MNQLYNDIADGFDILKKEQKEFWAAYWKYGDIKIEGNVYDQQALRYNMFQLRQNHPEIGDRFISANGLTGNKYLGRCFWDTDMFMFPCYNTVDPELAKNILMFRYNTLDLARKRAKKGNEQGANYPWQTILGTACSPIIGKGYGQIHLNSDIAYAVRNYYLDDDFLYRYGAEDVKISNAKTEFELIEGDKIEFSVYDKSVELDKGNNRIKYTF